MGELVDRRRKLTLDRIKKLQAELPAAEKRCQGLACVYATGSYGRLEASTHSDLDLFIVGMSHPDGKRKFRGLEEILVKADLIQVTRENGIKDFSGDGRYLAHYTDSDLIKTLGTELDDVENTFTARLLLLLESYPLLEPTVHSEVIDEVIAAYWRDFEDHKNTFMPAFLANDILRMWRTFCVNYEARTQDEPAEKKADRKLKNYKLKHSRLLTCYSALLLLLATFMEKQTVTPDDARAMVKLTPTGRLQSLLENKRFEGAHPKLNRLLESYEDFLQQTDATESALNERFRNKEESKKLLSAAGDFGSLMHESLQMIGSSDPFYRLLVV